MEQPFRQEANDDFQPDELTIKVINIQGRYQDPTENPADINRVFEEEILKPLTPFVLRKIHNTIPNNHDALDIFQQIMMRVWNPVKKGLFEGRRSQFNTWVYRIASNTLSEHIAKETIRRNREVLSNSGLVHLALVPAPDDVEDIAINNDQVKSINQKVAMNPDINERDKTIWTWRNQGIKYATIALLLGVSVPVVKTAYSRTNKRIREDFKK